MERDKSYYISPTRKQKQYILERDGVEDPTEYEIHHITPVLYAVAMLGLAREAINSPENLIALPKEEHREIHKLPHEMKDWQERETIYWHSDRDDEYRRRAIEATEAFPPSGNIFRSRGHV